MATENSYRVWIEDNILYNEYKKELSIDSILEVEKQSQELLAEKKIDIIPVIVLLGDVDKTKTDFKLSDWGKAISSYKLLNFLSAIIIVGADSSIQNILKIPNDIFLNGKMQFADSLEKAIDLARDSEYKKAPILESN